MSLVEGISLLASLLACLGVLFNIKHGTRQERNEDTNDRILIATNHTEVTLKLDMLSNQLKDIREDNEKKTEKLFEVNNRLINHEGKLEKLFEYKDDMELRLKALEKKT